MMLFIANQIADAGRLDPKGRRVLGLGLDLAEVQAQAQALRQQGTRCRVHDRQVKVEGNVIVVYALVVLP